MSFFGKCKDYLPRCNSLYLASDKCISVPAWEAISQTHSQVLDFSLLCLFFSFSPLGDLEEVRVSRPHPLSCLLSCLETFLALLDRYFILSSLGRPDTSRERDWGYCCALRNTQLHILWQITCSVNCTTNARKISGTMKDGSYHWGHPQSILKNRKPKCHWSTWKMLLWQWISVSTSVGKCAPSVISLIINSRWNKTSFMSTLQIS